MSNSYPIVILPEYMYLIKEELPPLPPLPIEPSRPKVKELKEPIEPSKPLSFEQVWGCSILAIGIFILIIYGVRTSEFMARMIEDADGLLILLFLATPIVAIYMIYSYHKNVNTEKLEYERKVEKYKEEVRQFNHDKINYKKDYENDIINFEHELYPRYLDSILIYDEEKKKILAHNNIHKYRMKLLANYFRSIKPPTPISNPYLTGVSEEAFFNFLRSQDVNFYKNHSLIEEEGLESYYVPDLVYFNRSNGLVIDIEIDEPYLGADGTPIHYEGYDDVRNKFFRKNGWIIVRFTEEQVVNDPTRCYEFIKNLVDRILLGKLEIEYSKIERFPQWTKDEGHKLAFSRYRNRYLKANLVERISEERLIEKRPKRSNFYDLD